MSLVIKKKKADHEKIECPSAMESLSGIATDYADIQLDTNLFARYMVAPVREAVWRLTRMVRCAVCL